MPTFPERERIIPTRKVEQVAVDETYSLFANDKKTPPTVKPAESVKVERADG